MYKRQILWLIFAWSFRLHTTRSARNLKQPTQPGAISTGLSGRHMQLSQLNGSPESEFIRHEPCEQCGSSDGKAVYSDHTHCFVCHHHVFSDGTFNHQVMTTNVELRGSAGRLQKRGISEQTCEKFKCYREGEKLRFYYFSSDGTLLGAKVRGKDKTFTCEGKVCLLYTSPSPRD